MSLSGALRSGIIQVLLHCFQPPGLLLHTHPSEGELAQSSSSGRQFIINFQSAEGRRRRIVPKSLVFGFEIH